MFPSLKEQSETNNTIYDELNSLEVDEHWEMAKSDHLEQLFSFLNNHRITLNNQSQVINKRYEELSLIRDIIDPDKFPIFSLM